MDEIPSFFPAISHTAHRDTSGVAEVGCAINQRHQSMPARTYDRPLDGQRVPRISLRRNRAPASTTNNLLTLINCPSPILSRCPTFCAEAAPKPRMCGPLSLRRHRVRARSSPISVLSLQHGVHLPGIPRAPPPTTRCLPLTHLSYVRTHFDEEDNVGAHRLSKRPQLMTDWLLSLSLSLSPSLTRIVTALLFTYR